MSEHIIQWVRYCAAEVERQHAGPIQVGDMFNALDHARMCYTLRNPHDPTADTMLGLTFNEVIIVACLVESSRQVNPIMGGDNWRKTNVTVNGMLTGEKPENIARQMQLWFQEVTNLLEYKPEGYNDQVENLIKHLLDIHPWADGNNRTASILRNWLLNQLDTPEPLPYYYSTECPNCHGSGTMDDPGDPEYFVLCEDCGGDGYIDRR